MPTLIATAGATDANSFITAPEFIAYLASRGNVPAGSTVTGTTLTDAEKIACIEATRDLDALIWKGSRVTSTQRLAMPRKYLVNPDAPTDEIYEILPSIEDLYFSETAIPQPVKDATCELALQYLKAGTTDLAALPATDGVIRKKVDVLETEYAQPHQRAQGIARFPRVMALIARLLEQTAGGLTVVRS